MHYHFLQMELHKHGCSESRPYRDIRVFKSTAQHRTFVGSVSVLLLARRGLDKKRQATAKMQSESHVKDEKTQQQRPDVRAGWLAEGEFLEIVRCSHDGIVTEDVPFQLVLQHNGNADCQCDVEMLDKDFVYRLPMRCVAMILMRVHLVCVAGAQISGRRLVCML